MPAVTRRLTDEFGFSPVLNDPDLSVAKGAALYGQKKELESIVLADLVAQGHLREGQTLDEAPRVNLDKAVKDAASTYGLPSDSVANIVETKVENVCSRGFGLFVMRGDTGEIYAHFLTHRNDRLPIEVQDSFGTVSESQTDVNIEVFEQGGTDESERPEDNRVIVEGSITGIPAGYPRGTEIQVTFAMGTDGILTVSARHVAKDEPLSLRVETGAARSEADIAREQQALDALKQKS